MAITLVRTATGPDQASLTVSFSENDGGDFLVAIFASVDLTGDASVPPATLTDTIGNVWNLVFSAIAVAGGASLLFNNTAVYVSNRCIATGSTNDFTMPIELRPPDVQATWSNGYEVAAPFALLTADVSGSFTGLAEGGVIDLTTTGAQDLMIAGVFDSSLTASVVGILSSNPVPSLKDLGFGGSGASVAGTNLYGWGDFVGAGFTDIIAQLDSSTDAFGFAVALTGTNANPAAGGNAQTLVFSINKGPEPIPPKEGRAIATVQIDCTQQPVQGSVNYPEFALFDAELLTALDVEGFTVCEFDLEHLFQGSGLSEVRTLMYWARPDFGFDANTVPQSRQDGGYETSYPSIITNTTTLQTICMGGSVASRIPGGSGTTNGYAVGASAVISFPANKHSLKYRFICPQNTFSNPLGKYNLQFTNFEVPPTPEQGCILSQSDD
jgi:hypothetical protein